MAGKEASYMRVYPVASLAESVRTSDSNCEMVKDRVIASKPRLQKVQIKVYGSRAWPAGKQWTDKRKAGLQTSCRNCGTDSWRLRLDRVTIKTNLRTSERRESHPARHRKIHIPLSLTILLEAKTMLMVTSDGEGHGSLPIATRTARAPSLPLGR